MKISKVLIIFVVAVFAGIIFTGHASADSFTYFLDGSLKGKSDGSTPYAVFNDDTGDANTVRLNMYSNDLDGKKYISEWFFNFDLYSEQNTSLLSFTSLNDSAVSSADTETGYNQFKADGDGLYDIRFSFPTASSDNRFNAYENITFDITYDSAIDISSFQAVSDPGNNSGSKQDWMSAAKIQGSGSGDQWSAASEVSTTSVAPEPVSSTLFFVGGMFITGRRFFKSRKA